MPLVHISNQKNQFKLSLRDQKNKFNLNLSAQLYASSYAIRLRKIGMKVLILLKFPDVKGMSGA